MTPALVMTALFAIAAVLSWAACSLVRRLRVLDAPDGERKLQAVPVPRLGGAGIMIAVVAVMIAASFSVDVWPASGGSPIGPFAAGLASALVFALCFTAIGLADDVVDLAATLKLVLLIAVCVLAPLSGIRIDALETPFGTAQAMPLLIAGSALWLLVFTNAANFMDGSNGLSMGALAIMFLGLGASLGLTQGHSFPPAVLIAAGALAGFLVHNMAGRLYAGDVGAFGVSGLFALLALISGLSAWTIATLALPFLADALLTLIARARRRQSLLTAHRDHTYQALLKAGWAHEDVAVFWWGLTASCAVAAAVGAAGGGTLPFWLFWSFTALFTAGWLILRREAGEIAARL